MGPHTLTLSGINEETLAKLNIIHQSYLQLKSGSEERAEERKLIGKDEFWSSTHMYRHLVVIKRLVPGEEFLGRGLTPFFFRGSAMVDVGKHMILNINFADYMTIVAEEDAADSYHSNSQIASAKLLGTAFFVAEARNGPLSHHIP